MLEQIFPDPSTGGVVCIIDNLELMKTSKDAREMIERARDVLLNAPGLRWVLSGAQGIVRGIASTPRLSGYLHEPIDIGGMTDYAAPEILVRRIEAFRADPRAALPIAPEEFVQLFAILNRNIRAALAETDNFCTNVYSVNSWSLGQSRRPDLFDKWLTDQCRRRLDAAEKQISAGNRPWRLFTDIIEHGGFCAPGDFETFGFDSPQAMRANVLQLESANVIQSSRNDDDNRRKTISVTPDGWLINHAHRTGIGRLFPKNGG
ncbi:MAG: hypothetical protein IT450_20140 [Phycisphaerales bacterium]|nr:hypothetical protein [Phycisphaerales bacterium]